MSDRVLVTAAGGKTGRHVIAALKRRGLNARALARSEGVHSLRDDGVDTIAGDMLDPAVLRRAVDDVQAIVHIGPALHPQEVAMGQAVVDAAVACGVERFVQFSVYHPQLEFLLNHQAKLRVEDYLVGAGLNYTILQPMHYMQNLDPAQIADARLLQLPYSLDMRLAFVDLKDVAEVAARVLTNRGHDYATYPLCGVDYLSGHDIIRIISERAGVSISGEELTVTRFVELISRDHDLPHYTTDAIYRLMTYYGLHGITGNSNILRWLLEREPGTFAAYVKRGLT